MILKLCMQYLVLKNYWVIGVGRFRIFGGGGGGARFRILGVGAKFPAGT